MTRGDLLRTSFGNLGRPPVRTVLSLVFASSTVAPMRFSVL